MEGRKKERKKSLIGFFVRKIRIQTIGLQLEPSKSILSLRYIYIYIMVQDYSSLRDGKTRREKLLRLSIPARAVHAASI